ncbi:methyltransferase [Nocardia panacis]|nr:methyltransferase [Nocardia panacis]
MTNSIDNSARRTIMRALFSTIVTQVVGVAARLRLADAIGDGEWDVADLAKIYEIPAERLNRLLRAMATLDLCRETTPGRFVLAPAGSLLRSDDSSSLLDLALLLTDKSMQDAWLNLETSLRTGRVAFHEVHGRPAFDYIAERGQLSEIFNSAMSQRTRADGVTAALPDHYDFGRFGAITDVGGGDGTLMAAILKRHPGPSGVVFDTAEGLAQATRILDIAGVSGRCKVAAGDFRQSVPAGSDLYVIKSVMHNWDDEHAVAILRNCRAAVAEGGRLLIVEPVLPDTVPTEHTMTEDPYLSDLSMMLLLGGRERTRGDYERLCARAGFALTRMIALPRHIDFAMIEAEPI